MKTMNKPLGLLYLMLGAAFFVFALGGMAKPYGSGEKSSVMSESNTPINLSVKYTDNHQIELSWNNVSMATKYNIYRARVDEKISGDISKAIKSDHAKFSDIGWTKGTEFTDSGYSQKTMKTEKSKMGSMKSMKGNEFTLVYYVTAVDNSGKESQKSKYADIQLDKSNWTQHASSSMGMMHEQGK